MLKKFFISRMGRLGLWSKFQQFTNFWFEIYQGFIFVLLKGEGTKLLPIHLSQERHLTPVLNKAIDKNPYCMYDQHLPTKTTKSYYEMKCKSYIQDEITNCIKAKNKIAIIIINDKYRTCMLNNVEKFFIPRIGRLGLWSKFQQFTNFWFEIY